MVSVLKVFAGKVGELIEPKKNEVISTAIAKEEVTEEVMVTKSGIVGDEQADTKNHGGLDKAILMYPSYHYPDFWQSKYPTMSYGAFGENISVRGLDEEEVCIGDIYKMGEVLIEVTQPRRPCFKPNVRYGSNEIMKDTINNKLTGWYVRILKEGLVKAGDEIVLMARPNPYYTIDRCVEIIHLQKDNIHALEDLVQVEQLAENLKNNLKEKIEHLSSK